MGHGAPPHTVASTAMWGYAFDLISIPPDWGQALVAGRSAVMGRRDYDTPEEWRPSAGGGSHVGGGGHFPWGGGRPPPAAGRRPQPGRAGRGPRHPSGLLPPHAPPLGGERRGAVGPGAAG